MSAWQMQEAKVRLSELVKSAENEGPQFIIHHGHSVAVVISQTTYNRLTGHAQGLEALMQSSPLFDVNDVQIDRDTSSTRDACQ